MENAVIGKCIDSASNTVCYGFLRHWKKALVGAYFQPQTLPISIIPLDPSRADFDFLTFSPHTHSACPVIPCQARQNGGPLMIRGTAMYLSPEGFEAGTWCD